MNMPLEDASKRLGVSHLPLAMTVLLPGVEPAVHPLEVVLDYWGRNPHLQVLLYDHDDEQGEPKVCVRYNQQGKIVEVVAGSENILIDAGNSRLKNPTDTTDTPWEVERDANPPCKAGDQLLMPSGQTATVITLHERYDNDFESFRAYDELYGIVERLNAYPGGPGFEQVGVYASAVQAWEDNPLTAGTTDPEDFSLVPKLKPTKEL